MYWSKHLTWNVRIHSRYRGRPALGRRISFARKPYNFAQKFAAKKVVKNPIVKDLGKMAAKELPKLYIKGVSDWKN